MKAIYMPKGKAGEYAKYACNFYVGCSNDCDYCYCKRGVLGHAMGSSTPRLKKCFKNEDDAYETFYKEMAKYYNELLLHNLFFTFTSDPMLPETINLTIRAVNLCLTNGVPVQILTKRADFICFIPDRWETHHASRIAIGFTLTGHDELEPHASTNAERIAAMRTLAGVGFKTFASIEPVVDLVSSMSMICETLGVCDLYRIGLMSGKRDYNRAEVQMFVADVLRLLSAMQPAPKVYFKDSVLEFLGFTREQFHAFAFDLLRPDRHILVNADYNMFKQ